VCRRGAARGRQGHPKTRNSRRAVAVPSFAAEAVRKRLAVPFDTAPDTLQFDSRNRTPLTPNNVRSTLRRVLGGQSAHVPQHGGNRVKKHAGVDFAPELLSTRPADDNAALHPAQRDGQAGFQSIPPKRR
jgi:hypothetical protein